MGLGDKQIASVSAHVRPSLEPGEQELAVLGQATVGPGLWLLAFLSPLLVFLQTPYGVVVTDRRVFLVRLAKKMTGYPPKNIEGEYEKSTVSADFNGGPITGTFHLRRPGADPMKMSVQTIYKDGARAVADAIGG